MTLKKKFLVFIFLVLALTVMSRFEHVKLSGNLGCTAMLCQVPEGAPNCCNRCWSDEWFADGKRVEFIFLKKAPACQFRDCDKNCPDTLWTYGYNGLSRFISIYSYWQK